MKRDHELEGIIKEPRRYTPVRYISDIENVNFIPRDEIERLKRVTRVFPFRSNDYYLSLIDRTDPNDPIRRIVIPDESELDESGTLDPGQESSFTVAPGCEHKYTNTAVLLSTDKCGGICRFCFRKRLFIDDTKEASRDISPGLKYISEHPEIDNVLVTGGDPLLLSTKRLKDIIEKLMAIPHVQIIRIGTKMPAYNPFRITDDPKLLDFLNEANASNCQIYMMTQFNHPREITPEAEEAIWRVRESGCRVHNQTPLLKGVNDNSEVLRKLANRLSYIGVTPYYIFQNRPVSGNRAFKVTLLRGIKLIEDSKKKISGLAKTARYILSHPLGKVEILGVKDGHFFFKFHQSRYKENLGKFFSCPVVESAYWLDDLEIPEDIRGSQSRASFA
ncbi:KamA family radical SAM protein [bacterium]|nr:KamA family radical SAM protein [bacterium]